MNSTSTWFAPGEALRFVGAVGGLNPLVGVAVTLVRLLLPFPTPFTARSLIVYSVLFTRPIMLAGLSVIFGLKAVQLVPSSNVYS